MSKLKNAQRDFILSQAIELFFKKSITSVTISEIAKDVGIGEATMYRYFGTKQNLVMECATKLSSDVFSKFFVEESGSNGFERLEGFYYNYLLIFKFHTSYFSFVQEFDAFMINEEEVSLADYEKEVDGFKKKFLDFYEEGIKDGSVRQLEDIESFYYASTHALLGLCKKLSSKKNFLISDAAVDHESEISALIKSFTYNLKG